MTPQQFIEKWRRADIKERSAYQEHFIDLCRLINHPTPAEADPHGAWFTFEAFANKSDGGNGFADVWKKDFFAWEYKGKRANLDEAYTQLLQYREALFNPPLLVVCDLERILIHTNFTNTAKRTIEITLDALLTPQGRAQLSAIFNQSQFFRAAETTAQVTQQAAQEFGKLAQLLGRRGVAPEQAAHFLIRLLFCLFAEDVGLLPNQIFSKLLHKTWANAADFTTQLRDLFRAMAHGGIFALEDIKRFNGGLFDDDAVYDLDSAGLDILRRVSALDWSSIEPSIFGTLFERSLDPAKRSQIGAHYTSKEDILLVVEPVLMQPLRRKWDAVQTQARALAAQRAGQSAAKRAALDKQLQTRLLAFQAEIARVSVLDPACGSGNFLYVALGQLLDLEKEVTTFMSELGLTRPFPTVHPAQLHGIEINRYAFELAQATIWIGYIQWFHENGFGFPPEPILKRLDNFRNEDAILKLQDSESSEPRWQRADIIIGNPPFLGVAKLRRELGNDYVDALWQLYGGRIPAKSDLVCYWFEKARAMVQESKTRRAGLLATQAIRKGLNRTVLERIAESGGIFMAYSDRPWLIEGASVRVSIIGFDNGSENHKTLDEVTVTAINSDLTSFTDVTKARPLLENSGLCFPGTKKYGAFDIDNDTAENFLRDTGNPNARLNSDVIKPWVNGSDITGRRRNMWIIDFGVDMSLERAAQYEKPFEYVEKHVKPTRMKERDAKIRENWWLFERTRPEMRKALAPFRRFVVTPVVAKYRVFAYLQQPTIPDAKLCAFSRDDDYFIGVLHSRAHEIWSLRNGARHGVGNDPTYNITTCFETFPFPFPPGQEKQADPRVIAIADAARALVELRDRWLNPRDLADAEMKKRTLTNLYNQKPQWLQNAHRKLDAAVFAAYGWGNEIAEEEILAQLLALNLTRASAIDNK